MTDDANAIDGSQALVRSRRLVQISTLTMAGLAVVLVRALLVGNSAAALILAIGMAISTELGWRQDRPADELMDRAIDTSIILSITGFAVWVMLGDMHRLLGRLRVQLSRYRQSQENLTYLQRFSIDKLKIDQSFVRTLMNGTQEQAIVSAIIHIARSLKLTTTAEGIEDEPTRRCLADLGCDQGQGYLFARPMPAAQFAAWLSDHNGPETCDLALATAAGQ